MIPSKRRRILVIGMPDSIHFAKWLRQFSDEEIDFIIFPSKKFRALHPTLKELVIGRHKASYKIIGSSRLLYISGYIDYIRFELMHEKLDSRGQYLASIIRRESFDYIHAVEIQGAGYLLIDSEEVIKSPTKIIVTNWGSDIYYFKNFPEHKNKISKVLRMAQYYSAECLRDYDLAVDMGFTGKNLPCIPNSGGLELANYESKIIETSKRNLIIVKGYGGTFGRILVVLNALEAIMLELQNFNVFIYSVTDDVEENVQQFSNLFPGRVKFQSIHKPLSATAILSLMLESRVYIGCSASDGISTSFLEAMATGAYPIQTNTSCANEWVDKGAIATLLPVDEIAIKDATRKALSDDALVDEAQIQNLKIIKKNLSVHKITAEALKFYLS